VSITMAEKTLTTRLARAIAAEDIRPGIYVAELNVIEEHVPFACDIESMKRLDGPVRLRWLPMDVDPVKVVAVCLPYVFVRGADGDHRTVDVRRVELARLPKAYGRAVWRALREDAQRARGGKRRTE
jgi:hypothetical protein